MIEFNLVVNVLSMLIVILGLIVLMGYIFKKYNIIKPNVGDCMELISGTTIGKKNKIVLIEVLDKKILIGVSEQNINTLCVFESDPSTSGKTLQVKVNE